MKQGQKFGETAAKLDAFGLEAMCEALAEGVSMRKIAKQLGVCAYSISTWCADESRVEQIRQARAAAAEHYADMAEQALLDVSIAIEKGIDGRVAISKGRDLAHHYRWMAKMCDPTRYGDRVALDHSVDMRAKPDALVDARIAELIGKAGIAGLAGGKGQKDREAED